MHGELFVIALTFGVALLGGRAAVRFGYPSVLGELLGGIVFGPPILGLLDPSEPLQLLGEFGVLLMMVLIGMHLDIADLRKASTPGLLAAAGGFLIPAGLGIGLMYLFGESGMAALFVGLAMGVTSLATKSRILVDLRILDTRIAHVLMVGALVSDLAVLLVFSAVIGEGGATGTPMTILITGLEALAFLIVSYLIGTKVIPLITARTPSRPDGASAYLLVVMTGLLFGWMAEAAGLHAILGAFVGGLFLSGRMIGARTSREVQRRLTTISVGTLAPLFFISAGFDVSMSVFRTDLALLLSVILVATVGKIVGTTILYVRSGNGWREGVVLGAGMNGRGAVEIIVAELALEQGLIDQTVFSILVFMAITTTATVPVLLTRGVAWLRDRGELVKAGDRRAVMIVGAHPLARTIARLLVTGSPVILVDSNEAHVSAAQSEGLTVHKGNALDDVVLEEAGIDQTMTFIAATANPEVNLLTARSAQELGVSSVIVVIPESSFDRFESMLTEIGADSLVVPDTDGSWDEAIRRGLVEVRTGTVREDGTVTLPRADDSPSSTVFPIVLGADDDRRLASRGTDARPGEPYTVLVRHSGAESGRR
ncbi:MAG TPA: cation:proton antiporter [Acidimicrobiia bacterium]|nr:cation:proton antiporter [Acidimicrobiia bacterium]